MKGEFKAASVTQNQKVSEATISFICRDSMECIITKERKSTEDTSVLLAKTLTIRNALIHAINSKYSNVIIESDSMIMIQAINKESIPSKDICNLVEDIVALAKNIENIDFYFVEDLSMC